MSNKRRKKRAYEVELENTPKPEVDYPSTFVGPVFDFFNRRGVRETIESIVIAVVLAMVFRTFGAEAYIIPTGSMAPTLQGQHMDVVCDQCGYRYRAGASEDNTTIPANLRRRILETQCPFCRSELVMNKNKDADHVSNNGDRIVVNKFIYDFRNPDRFDVIVFKDPNNGKVNFIKRLVGLPNEDLIIENGDVFVLNKDLNAPVRRKIVRKPPEKLRAMLQVVDDTDYVAQELVDHNWPARWQAWGRSASDWETGRDKGKYKFSLTNTETKTYLRYRHLVPEQSDWDKIENGKPVSLEPIRILGRLIGDYYCYNSRLVSGLANDAPQKAESPENHWVGDLGLEVNVKVESNSGKLYLDLVEGGVHFELAVDLSNGQAELSNSGGYPFSDNAGAPIATPLAETPIKGSGDYDILFTNCDDQLRLWVNGKHVKFSGSCYLPAGRVNPKWSETDAGDAEPAGVSATGADVEFSRLRIFRDIYYSSVLGRGKYPQNETELPPAKIQTVMRNPKVWEAKQGLEVFNARFREDTPMFTLEENQFLPMGDNSPESSDGRIWNGPHFLPGELLIGRALFVYWPHSKNKPIPYFPNFERMGPIR